MSIAPTVIVVERTRTATVQADAQQPSVVTTNEETGVVSTEESATAVEVVAPGTPRTVLSYRGPQGERGEQGPQGVKGDDGAVMSVNAQIGDVLLDADDVGADPVGAGIAAASAAVSLHVADPDPHTQYLSQNEPLDGGNF